MLFKLDENLPSELAADLEAAGHSAETVFAENLSGAPDETVVQMSQSEGRILFTLDKGIADIRRYPPGQLGGVVLFRPSSSGRGEVLAFVRANLPEILSIDLSGRLLVVSNRGLRLR
jgi:predicted nuclease of predicted toxin-antitoxin system